MTTTNTQPETGATPEPKCDEPSNWVHRMVRLLRLRLSLWLMPSDLRTNMHTAAEAWWSARSCAEDFHTRLAYIREIELRKHKPLRKSPHA